MPPAREDVVTYLQAHLTEFPVEELRRQLRTEGVTDAEFDEALKSTLRAPGGAVKAPAPKKPSAKSAVGKVILGIGVVSIMLAAVIAVMGPGETEKASGPASAAPGAGAAASAHVGRSGWVARLPAGYATTPSPRNSERMESVYFHRAGLDSASLLDEGLFGPLGIVRLDVQNNPFGDTLSPVDTVATVAAAKARERGEKFVQKPVQVSTLKGVQFAFDAPNARVETYVIGQRNLYAFYAGQDDDVFREILLSLRDTASEN